MRVDEAVVISLPSRHERLAKLKASLPQPWPFPPLTVHPGVIEQSPPWFRSSNGAWGCRQAHLQILQSAWDRGVGATLVLEDDAVFCAGFTNRWNLFSKQVPRSWSMVMLGGEHVADPVPRGTQVVRCTDTRRTHAYIIRLKAIPLLMRIWGAHSRHIDHASAGFQAAVPVFAPEPLMVGQDGGWSDISRKENPDVRFWN